MAIAATSIGSLGNTANISTYTCTLARAPAANALLIASVHVTDTAGTPVQPTSVRGADFIFSLITSSITFRPPTAGSQIANISHWRSMSPTALSGTTVGATFPNAATGCMILVTEFTGVDTSGTSGSGAVGSSANSDWEAQSSLTLMGPAAGNVNNAWYSSNGVGAGAAGDLDVPDNNYTDMDQANYNTPNSGLHSAWTTLSTGTLMRWAGAGTQGRAGCLIEIVAAAVGGGATVVDTWQLRRLYEGYHG